MVYILYKGPEMPCLRIIRKCININTAVRRGNTKVSLPRNNSTKGDPITGIASGTPTQKSENPKALFCSCNYNAKKSSRRSRLYVDRYRPLESSIYLLISFSLL
ncbi:hypothetical protein ES319_D08G137300v1 [Gossypium barbadense]|uniref:Uncharacterized protein n=1 Tax=Gossypium barbadense TaxID=3634 RepID=A0A5J5QFS1_GOSBA|nr:hypothetical protein ES319_D08G137300v1 [Gossypium barbadense]